MLEQFLEEFPGKGLDRLDAIKTINDRFAMAQALDCLDVTEDGVGIGACRWWGWEGGSKESPPFGAPWVCKPRMADGSADAHKLCVCWTMDALRQLEGEWRIEPYVVHDGAVRKVYALGEHVHQLLRPSFPPLASPPPSEAGAPQWLPRHSPSKALAAPCQAPELSAVCLRAVARAIGRRLGGCALWGADMLWDVTCGRYVVIDINYCPGYYGVPSLFPRLTATVLSQLSATPSPPPPQQELQLSISSCAAAAGSSSSCLLLLCRFPDLWALLCSMLSLADVTVVASLCRDCAKATSHDSVWRRIAAARTPDLPRVADVARTQGWRSAVLRMLLPGCWTGSSSRLAVCDGSRVVQFVEDKPLSELRPYGRVKMQRGGRLVGVGLSAASGGGEETGALWLPPFAQPQWVWGSGFWRNGSRAGEGRAGVRPEQLPTTVGIRCQGLGEGAMAMHFFLDDVYAFSAHVSDAKQREGGWRMAVAGKDLEASLEEGPLLPLPAAPIYVDAEQQQQQHHEI